MANATRKVPHDTLLPYSKDPVSVGRWARLKRQKGWRRPEPDGTSHPADELVREWIAERVAADRAARQEPPPGA